MNPDSAPYSIAQSGEAWLVHGPHGIIASYANPAAAIVLLDALHAELAYRNAPRTTDADWLPLMRESHAKWGVYRAYHRANRQKLIPNPSRGLRFTHATWIDYSHRPATVQVTRVASGDVFYAMSYENPRRLGARYRIPLDQWHEIWLDQPLNYVEPPFAHISDKGE